MDTRIVSSYDQLDLLSRPGDPAPSLEAGEAIRPHVAGMKLAILQQLATTRQGLTAAELVDRFEVAWSKRVQQSSVARRLTTLRGQGLASVDGTRPGHTGRDCAIWILTDLGREALR